LDVTFTEIGLIAIPPPSKIKKSLQMFGYDMVLPMNTGAEGVETALKLARKWGYLKKRIPENKAIIISCTNNFHGRTLAIVAMSTDSSTRRDFGPFNPGLGSLCPATGKSVAHGSIDDLRAALAAHSDRVAAFLVEPIQGEAG
jgi:ornithine--oxo-acid transaminase